MRYSIIFIFLIYMAAYADSKCKYYRCRPNYKPVCGKRLINGCWYEEIFRNQCYMNNANACEKVYVPCVENVCPSIKPSPRRRQ